MDEVREIFLVEDTPAAQISYWFILIFLVSLPFDQLYSELALIGLLLHTMIHLSRAKIAGIGLSFANARFPHIFFGKAGLPVLSLYVLTIFGTIYSLRPDLAWSEWEKQLALLLFPLIFYFTDLDLSKYRWRFLKAFAFTCLFTTMYLYWEAFHTILRDGLPLATLFSPLFINHRFSAP